MAGGKHNRKILMALLFVGTALAMPVACMNADDAENVESQWSAVTTTNCDSKDADGNYIIPSCDDRCRKSAFTAEFVATSFDIEGTLGGGEHTGSASWPWYVEIDDRFPPDKPYAPDNDACPSGATGPKPDNARHYVIPANVRMCSDDKVNRKVMDAATRFHNHGRTTPQDRCLIRLVAHKDSSLSPRHEDPGYTTWKNLLPDFQTCTSLSDGWCDTKCSNCSYVMPPGACGAPGALFGTPDPTGVEQQCGCLSSPPIPPYSTTPIGTCGINCSAWKTPDPFTHCGGQQWGLTGNMCLSPDVYGYKWPFYSGKWGHNSNTDFDAADRAFSTCAWGSSSMWNKSKSKLTWTCGICGTGGPPQNPCGAKTNTAWEKANWGDGCQGRGCNISCDTDHADCGADAPVFPRCGGSPTGIIVKGM